MTAVIRTVRGMSAAGVCLLAAFCTGGCLTEAFAMSWDGRRARGGPSASKRVRERDRAIANCTKAIELNPRSASAYRRRAEAYGSKRDHDRAIADYTKAIELKPRWAGVYNDRGVAYRLKGDYDRAIADCTKAIRLKRDWAEAYLGRGLAYGEKGEHDRAREDLERVIILDPYGGIGRLAGEELRRPKKRKR